jgi:hypothetical protein
VPTHRAVTSPNYGGWDAMGVVEEIAAVKDVLAHIEPFPNAVLKPRAIGVEKRCMCIDRILRIERLKRNRDRWQHHPQGDGFWRGTLPCLCADGSPKSLRGLILEQTP